jgi:hypothetical protein
LCLKGFRDIFKNIFKKEGQRWPTRRKNGRRERESADWFS